MSKTGFTDLNLELLYISYTNKSKTFGAYIGTDFWVPTGSYRRGRMVNLGYNYYTLAPALHVTWLPTRRAELSASFVPEINWKNKATDYRSGNAVTIDASASYRPLPDFQRLQVGLQGYFHKQVQDDRLNGEAVPGGFRGQSAAIGPQVKLNLFERGGLLFKWQHEFAVENRAKGNRLWLQFSMPLN